MRFWIVDPHSWKLQGMLGGCQAIGQWQCGAPHPINETAGHHHPTQPPMGQPGEGYGDKGPHPPLFHHYPQASRSTVSGPGQALLHIYLTNAGICSANVAPRTDQRTVGWPGAGAKAVPAHFVTWCKLHGSSLSHRPPETRGATNSAVPEFAMGLASSEEFSSWLPPQRGQRHKKTLHNNYKLSLFPSWARRYNWSPTASLVHLLNSTI